MQKKWFVIYFIIVVLIMAGLVLLYLQTLLDAFRIAILALLVFFSAVGVGVLIHFVRRPNRLRILLKEMEIRVLRESPDVLKESYVKAYTLYLTLSEKEKQNFYGRIVKLRQKLEVQMIAAKKVEELAAKGGSNDLRQLQKTYEELYHHFCLLSPAVQEKYYVQVMHMKNRLEKGVF